MSIHGLGGPGGIGGRQGGPDVKQHVVREGETLATIGEKHGVGRQALADANPHLGGAEPKAGMSLEIPSPPSAWGDPHVAGHEDTFEKASQNLFETLGMGDVNPPEPVRQSEDEVRALGGGFDATGVMPAETRALGGGFDATGVHPQGYIHDGSSGPLEDVAIRFGPDGGQVGAGDDRSVKIAPGDDRSVKIAPGDDRSVKIAPGDDRSIKVGPGEGSQASPLEDVSIRFGPDGGQVIGEQGTQAPDVDADLGGIGKKGE
jgi:LysM repeat protein